MKNILVAIDFSPCSLHALEFAIFVSNNTGADIKMLWVHKKHSSFLPFKEGETKETRVESVNQEFEKIIALHQPNCKGNFSYEIREGKIHNQIAIVAKEEKMDLVIAGTHGIAGFDEYWVGSNAFRIISYTDVPVITIREDFDFSKGINKIVVPIDYTRETRQKVPFTAKIAKIFNSTVYIASYFDSKNDVLSFRIRSYTKQVQDFFDKENVKYKQIDLITDSPEKRTISFAKEIGADLIAIIAVADRSTFNVVFSTHARPIINHSEIPVLCVTENENIFSNPSL